MLKNIMSFLSPFIPVGLAVKGLEKINPKMKSFFGGALAAGYTVNQALDYLRSEGSSLNEGNSRPDELAAQNRRQNEEVPLKIGKGAAVLGASALGGIGAAAATGANALSQKPQQPQEAGQSGQAQGYDPLAGLKEFPELIKFIQEEQARGGNAQSIASKARKSVKLGTYVNTIEQTANEPFENLLARLLGSGGQGQHQSQPQSNAMGELKSLIQQYMQAKTGRL